MFAGLPRVLTVAGAEQWGVTEGRRRAEVRRGNWQRLGHGVLLTNAQPPTREDWIDVGLALAGPSGAVSAWDALSVYGLARGAAPSRPVLVLTGHAAQRRVGGVHIRRTKRPYDAWMLPPDAGPLAGRFVVGAARAVADAAIWSRDAAWVRALVTSSVQRRRCTVPDLVAELEASPQNGSHWLRVALSDAAAGARSLAEAEARTALLVVGAPAFEMNVPVVNEHGDVLYVLDFLWRRLRVALEVDGREFHLSEAAWKATMARHIVLSRAGLTIEHHPPSSIRERGWADGVAGYLWSLADGLGVPRSELVTAFPAADPPPYVIPGLRAARPGDQLRPDVRLGAQTKLITNFAAQGDVGPQPGALPQVINFVRPST